SGTQNAQLIISGSVDVSAGDEVHFIALSSVATNLVSSLAWYLTVRSNNDLSAIVAIAGQSKFQVKTLSGNVTGNGVIADFTTAIVVGRTYQVGGFITMRVNSGGVDNTVYVTLSDGPTTQNIGITATEDTLDFQ